MYQDRLDAAQQLAAALQEYKDNKDVIILAIPRGALEIGSVLATELNAPLDVIFTKKIGAPGNPEMAIGTVSMDEIMIAPEFNEPGLEPYIEKEVKAIRATIKERMKKYRGNRPPLDLKNKIVILTDDGIATGYTLRLAAELIKKQHPKKLIVAVPVGPPDTIEQLKKEVDEVVCPLVPESLFGISQFYQRFPQVEDEQAITLLNEANA